MLAKITNGINWLTYVSSDGNTVVNMDLSAYMKAGYVPQCCCLAHEGVGYVRSQLEMDSRLAEDNCTIEVEIAPGLWTASGYYWESNVLFRKDS